MKNIIEEAFIEGRETKIHWNDSNAKQDAIKLQVFADNTKNYNQRVFCERLCIAKIDPNTSDELEVY